MATSHITNGDVVADSLRQLRSGELVIPWRDVLHDGPVPPASNDREFASVRARFIAAREWTTEAEVQHAFATRDSEFDSASDADEVVLWFEPDLYDQLQLAQVLSRIRAKWATAARISIVPADCLLGPLQHSGYAPLFDSRRALRDTDLSFGAEMWSGLTAPEPDGLHQLMITCTTGALRNHHSSSYAASIDSRLPYAGDALLRLFEEYPSIENGLSRTERQICAVLRQGPLTIAKSYPRAHHQLEEWTWLGDWSYAWYVERLSSGDHPLVTYESGERVVATQIESAQENFWHREITLTDVGREVLNGHADAIEQNGIDRWIGGVHHTGKRHWRWSNGDRTFRRVVRTVIES